MQSRLTRPRRTWAGILAVALATGPSLISPPVRADVAASEFDENARVVSDFDVRELASSVRRPTALQFSALESLKASLSDPNLTARWDKTTGSVDVVYDFASTPSTLDPEAAARSFIEAHHDLFRIDDLGTLELEKNVAALGGHLLYFRQIHAGIPVAGRGVGVMLDSDKRVKMISGPYEPGLSVDTTPSLDGAAVVAAAQADLAPFQREWPAAVAGVLNTAYDAVQAELGFFAVPHPVLNVFPTANGGRLAWNFFQFSRNPFGVFEYQVDAHSGEVLKRTDRVLRQEALPFTADIYPSSPKLANPDTGELAKDANGEPKGLLRVNLRGFNPGTNATAVNGTMSGTHALIRNLLATQLPFSQAAAGTFHFRQNNPPLEAQPNEQDDLAEPAEHIDMVNNFFFINYLLEYVDHLHRAGDSVHTQFGQGDFPDSYPNSDRPLVGMVHMPSDLGLLGISGPLDTESPDTILRSALGLDNAVSFSLSQTIPTPAGPQTVVINPTAYGHGYLFNDLAKDGPVVYHEGMHSISTPIAGYDDDTVEGGALNEGQADLWAYTITEDPVLGNYVVNGHRIRQQIREAGGDPDLRQWIRHADSGLTYSRLGTRGGNTFEVHRDGEIYASATWDLRELLLMFQQGGPYRRPKLVSGEVSEPVSLGKETWERLQLGATYVLGAFRPDTFVRARDAMILADQALYPSDPLDPEAPGLHRALIEQVHAARELGINAAPPVDGRQTISTQVSEFAASQAKPAAPAGVNVTPASPTSNRMTWQPVQNAFAYQILRRAVGRENQRQNVPVPGREYIDGDGSTDGFLAIDYVAGAQTTYVDNGLIESGFVRQGNGNAAAWEYAVKAFAVSPNRQVGVSDASTPASAATAVLDVTSRVRTTIGNISFTGGRTEFDQTLTNLGAGAFDGTIYVPIAFNVVSISSPMVTVANADNAGSGQSGSPAAFYFRPTLATGQVSQPRHLVFNNPNTQLFTFNAAVTARVQVDPASATRYEPEPPPDLSGFERKDFTDVFTGTVPASDLGQQTAENVTYVDVPFTSRAGAFAVNGDLTSSVTGVDLDLYLLDSNGNQIAASESGGTNETVAAAIEANRQYTYRVVGWAGVAQDFTLTSTQSALVPKPSPSSGGSGTPVVPTVTRLLQFTVNPLTQTVLVLLR